MKKIIFILLIFIVNFSVFSNEKIVDIKFKNDGERKFYLVDEEGKMEYGFYEYNFYKKIVRSKDETIEPFNGKIDLNLIKKVL